MIGDPLDTGLNPNTCRYNFADQVSVISSEERAQVLAEFDWEFSDSVKYYAEASFSDNKIRPRPAVSCWLRVKQTLAVSRFFRVIRSTFR